MLDTLSTADSFGAKRLLPKLRYRFGRMAYLGEPGQLAELAAASDGMPALRFHSAVTNAIASGDISEVLQYGVNAAQAAAQPLRMRSIAVTNSDAGGNAVSQQALAVFRMNGLALESDVPSHESNGLLRFASQGADRSMMRGDDPFIREIACLHGVADGARHDQMLNTAFDRAEEIALDAVEQEHQSS